MIILDQQRLLVLPNVRKIKYTPKYEREYYNDYIRILEVSMKELELLSFKIISSVGMAKSSYMEAIKIANMGDFIKAEEKIKEGEEFFNQGHQVHASLLQMEANKEIQTPTVLLIHAEDQLMSAETIHTLALQLILLQKRLYALENQSSREEV
jgi:PTS system cellobiose-specific IIA component